ncbi:hypothetical protein M2110_000515 [Paenibacillus sp. PastF-4]|nr:hypothetical protein [Paenibacillus sp. PastF-4]MDH6441986.1 hypothetical protein [Paenibacillus sp. PastF-4]
MGASGTGASGASGASGIGHLASGASGASGASEQQQYLVTRLPFRANKAHEAIGPSGPYSQHNRYFGILSDPIVAIGIKSYLY